MEIIKIIALFADVALLAVMCVMIYRLQKKVEALNEQLKGKSVAFRVSGNDLVGVLEKANKAAAVKK